MDRTHISNEVELTMVVQFFNKVGGWKFRFTAFFEDQGPCDGEGRMPKGGVEPPCPCER